MKKNRQPSVRTLERRIARLEQKVKKLEDNAGLAYIFQATSAQLMRISDQVYAPKPNPSKIDIKCELALGLWDKPASIVNKTLV